MGPKIYVAYLCHTDEDPENKEVVLVTTEEQAVRMADALFLGMEFDPDFEGCDHRGVDLYEVVIVDGEKVLWDVAPVAHFGFVDNA